MVGGMTLVRDYRVRPNLPQGSSRNNGLAMRLWQSLEER